MKVSWLFPNDLRAAVASEAIALVDRAGTRRVMSFAETEFTPRRMTNLPCSEIAQASTAIVAAYQMARQLPELAMIAGEELHACPYEPERIVITRLEHPGDTHGWHWDDYGFALVWIAECPSPQHGGLVEFVPNTTWDKADPGISEVLRERRVHRLDVGAGDVYLMRTDTTLHRVSPIAKGRRTIVNMAFARAEELSRPVSHETMDALWAVPGGRSEEQRGRSDHSVGRRGPA
nr:hypothetical protein [Nocardia camponoti]